MSYIDHREVKARKRHRCLWCGDIIQPSERYILVEWVNENEHGRDRYHRECHKAKGTLSYENLEWWNDEGCVPKFQRGHNHETGWDTAENCAEQKCPACINALERSNPND